MSIKCVVVGDVNGQADVLKKIATLHIKNNFAFAIICGDLFADTSTEEDPNGSLEQALLDGNISVPLPTYFAVGKRPLSTKVIEKLENNHGELCDNLICLGKRTTIKTSEGVRIVALGGILDPNVDVAVSKDRFSPLHSSGDANALKGANSTDILITSQWPDNITKGSKTAPDGLQASSPQKIVAELCSTLKPRYHFSTSSDHFYEREPFYHALDEGADPSFGYRITRFIALAPYGNPSKQKWIYAFSIDPQASNPVTVPTGTTASPVGQQAKKRQALKSQPQEYSRYGGADAHSYDSRPNKRRKGQARQPPPGPQECFFCLSNPELSQHLITSIGDNAYMTTAKGPLTTSSTFSDHGLDVPGHMLIIPLAHSATLTGITDVQSRHDTLTEMSRFKVAAQKMISETSHGQLGTVTWEVRRSQGVHTHWQLLPVPVDLIRRGLVEAAFKVEAENDQYPAFEVVTEEDADDISDRLDVWISSPNLKYEAKSETNGEEPTNVDKKISLPLSSDFRFDLQFGRRVMAKLLSLGNRAHWRDCVQSEDDETREAEQWKKLFKDHDFTLDD